MDLQRKLLIAESLFDRRGRFFALRHFDICYGCRIACVQGTIEAMWIFAR